MSPCPCPKHPFGCYGHPHACGCAKTEKSKDAEIAGLRAALEEIANETEVHTKLNQERLCCKFQDIARRALGGGYIARITEAGRAALRDGGRSE